MTLSSTVLRCPSTYLTTSLWIVCIALVSFESTQAAVTAIGNVNPVPPSNGGEVFDQIQVGGNNDFPAPAWLTIDNGSTLTAPGISIESLGTLNVKDPGSFLDLGNGTLDIGIQEGLATLNIDNGGYVFADQIRTYRNSTINLSGPQSTLSYRNGFLDGIIRLKDGAIFSGNLFENSIGLSIDVQDTGSVLATEFGQYNGELSISNGGSFIGNSRNQQLFGNSSHTDISVYGIGSRWQTLSTVSLGNPNQVGSATLRIENQATVSLSTLEINARSDLRLNGGLLSSSNIMNHGIITGDGTIQTSSSRGFLNNESSAIIQVDAGAELTIQGQLNNSGSINVQGGSLDVTSSTFIRNEGSESNSSISLEEGTIYFRGGLDFQFDQNEGILASVGGTNHIFGDIMYANFLATGNSHTIFHDSLHDAQIDIQPGSSITVLGSLNFAEEFSESLSSVTANETQAPIVTSGIVELDGDLALELAPGTVVTPGDSFDIISSSTGFSGSFASVAMPSIEGIHWEVEVFGSTLSLVAEEATGLAGDFNNDGSVDASDYTVWRNGLGTNYTHADYESWASNYGSTLSTASSTSVAIPEPSTHLLAMLMLGLCLLFNNQSMRTWNHIV